jgi:hypothetical protein
MGFSGGGSNVLLPHTHDGRVSQDGGPLQFNNVTQSQSAAGEVFFSDGTALQQLAYPAVPSNETLTAAAASTAPSWVAAGGGAALEKIDSDVLLAPATTIGLSFPAVAQTGVSKFYGVLNAQKAAAGNVIHLEINGITSATYTYNFQEFSAGVVATGQVANSTELQVVRNWGETLGQTVFFEIVLNSVTDIIQYSTLGTADVNYKTCVGTNSTAGQSSLDEIKFLCLNPAGNFATDTTLSLYKVNLA